LCNLFPSFVDTPISNGILLSTKRINHVKIDQATRTATFGAGVSNFAPYFSFIFSQCTFKNLFSFFLFLFLFVLWGIFSSFFFPLPFSIFLRHFPLFPFFLFSFFPFFLFSFFPFFLFSFFPFFLFSFFPFSFFLFPFFLFSFFPFLLFSFFLFPFSLLVFYIMITNI
jgi:hypothetical protein